MRINYKNITGIFIIALLVSCGNGKKVTETKSPNIVFFFVDDMGWQNTSVPFHTEVTELNKRYVTPNMEQLAKEGVKFTQAYASAVCSPSRVSLMTGMNAARHRVTNWTLWKDDSRDSPHPTVTPPKWNVNGLTAEAGQSRAVYTETLPQLLKKGGYKTIHVGKAHFGAKDTSGEDPLNLGFDVNIGGHAAGGPGSYWGTKNFSAVWRKGMAVWDVPGLEKYHGKDVFLTEALTLEANEAINQAVKENKPFYLYMSHYAIHAPWEKDERFYQKYIDAGLKEFEATNASMIEGMDKSLGDLMANLKRLGIEDNTIIVFMSDNGAPKPTARNLPLRGFKKTPYEGGSRVPMIVKWPGVTKAETSNNNYLLIEDVFPSFLEMAGLDEEAKKSKDGVSFVPIIKGDKTNVNDRALYWHSPNISPDNEPFSAIRKGSWKLIYHHANRKMELFNLEKDLSETTDLFTSDNHKAKELAGLLSDYLISVEAQMPIDKATGNPVEYPKELFKK